MASPRPGGTGAGRAHLLSLSGACEAQRICAGHSPGRGKVSRARPVGSSGLKPHLPVFPLPILSCRKEEALPVAQAISQVTITTKHLKCQHLWWVAFRHNWRQSGNTTRAPCKRKEREARREENQEGWELRREREEDQDKQGSRCCRSGHVHHPWGPGFLPVWRADGS